MLNYLVGSTRSNVSIAVYQVAHFVSDPKRLRKKGVMRSQMSTNNIQILACSMTLTLAEE